jgi:hypothetical protein
MWYGPRVELRVTRVGESKCPHIGISPATKGDFVMIVATPSLTSNLYKYIYECKDNLIP